MPPGVRAYAIGDVHGRADLLELMLSKIGSDDAARGPAETHIVFLGDLVDRGANSRGVVEQVMQLASENPRVHLLMGNHEEVFLKVLAGDVRAIRLFANIGGRETLASYGITPAEFENGSFEELAALVARRVPETHHKFLASGASTLVLGDYLFVHAGIRPDIALDEQSEQDLRWIRNDFLDFEGELDKVVVHGHSIADEVQQRPHRIGVDTGAYRTGTLTALALEGEERWFIQARGTEAA